MTRAALRAWIDERFTVGTRGESFLAARPVRKNGAPYLMKRPHVLEIDGQPWLLGTDGQMMAAIPATAEEARERPRPMPEWKNDTLATPMRTRHGFAVTEDELWTWVGRNTAPSWRRRWSADHGRSIGPLVGFVRAPQGEAVCIQHLEAWDPIAVDGTKVARLLELVDGQEPVWVTAELVAARHEPSGVDIIAPLLILGGDRWRAGVMCCDPRHPEVTETRTRLQRIPGEHPQLWRLP